jgi:integrase/recombinase XerD
MHPHVRHRTFVTIGFDAGVSLRDLQIADRHADPMHHHDHPEP